MFRGARAGARGPNRRRAREGQASNRVGPRRRDDRLGGGHGGLLRQRRPVRALSPTPRSDRSRSSSGSGADEVREAARARSRAPRGSNVVAVGLLEDGEDETAHRGREGLVRASLTTSQGTRRFTPLLLGLVEGPGRHDARSSSTDCSLSSEVETPDRQRDGGQPPGACRDALGRSAWPEPLGRGSWPCFLRGLRGDDHELLAASSGPRDPCLRIVAADGPAPTSTRTLFAHEVSVDRR